MKKDYSFAYNSKNRQDLQGKTSNRESFFFEKKYVIFKNT